MSCGRIALERAEIPIDTYYASEIDEGAELISQVNYPDIIRLGDVTKWPSWNIAWSSIDLVLAGSPCQGFSFAGGQLAFDDERSKLFFTFIDILNHIKERNPSVKFLLENVKMSERNLKVISEFTGVEPIFINSALVSAQTRQRYYWCNWKTTQPKDKGIMLKDIIEPIGIYKCQEIGISSEMSGEDAVQYLLDHSRDMFWIAVDRQKSHPIDANYWKGGNLKRYNKSSRQLVFTNFDRKNYRNLTPEECERLQNVPEGFTKVLPKVHRYKALGNGWTVDVIAHLLSEMDNGDASMQQSLFEITLDDVIN